MTTIVPYDATDERFVVSGWSSSQRMTRDIPLVPMAMWADNFWHPVVRAALARETASTLVAVGSERDARRGFICYEPGYVMYCYVAEPYRRNGVARELFAAANIDPSARFTYACRTKSSWMLRGKVPFASYDPMRARFAPGKSDQ